MADCQDTRVIFLYYSCVLDRTIDSIYIQLQSIKTTPQTLSHCSLIVRQSFINRLSIAHDGVGGVSKEDISVGWGLLKNAVIVDHQE